MNKVKEETSQEIAVLYSEGTSSYLIAEKFGVSVPTVCRHLKKRGVKCRPQHVAKRTYGLNERYFSAIDSHEKAQIFGMLCADGNVAKKRHVMEITLHPTDEEYLNHIKKCLRYEGPLSPVNRKDGKRYVRLCITSLVLRSSLIALGMTPKKSLTLDFPASVPEEFVPSFVLGYHEGDGNINVWKGKLGLDSNLKFCVTKQFGETLQKIFVEKLGVNSCLHLCKLYREIRYVNMYSLGVSGNQQVKRVCEWMYSNAVFKMKRKYDDYLYLLSHYDAQGNMIKANDWLDIRNAKCQETFQRNGTKPGVKASRCAHFLSPDEVVYYTNNMTRFARDFGLAPSETYNMIDGIRKTPHRGWSPASPDQIAVARANGTLVTKHYGNPPTPAKPT